MMRLRGGEQRILAHQLCMQERQIMRRKKNGPPKTKSEGLNIPANGIGEIETKYEPFNASEINDNEQRIQKKFAPDIEATIDRSWSEKLAGLGRITVNFAASNSRNNRMLITIMLPMFTGVGSVGIAMLCSDWFATTRIFLEQ